MQRQSTRVQRRPVHGVLLLDKPLGLSSNQALQKAKWLLRAEKAGHTGTLDPLATGVLPLCFGAATKFSQLQLDADKTYEAVARLGLKTSTGDAEGELIEERPVAELFSFQGRSHIPEGLQGRYPAFDVTPASLISSLIGFDGTFTPESFRQRFQNTPAAASHGKNEKEPYILLYGIPKSGSYSHLSSALKAQRAQTVLVPEMRPELWGVHVIARELLQRNIPTTLISDNMMGAFFAQGQIKRLYLFYSELSEKGPVGICGSLLATLLAAAHGVSVELLASEEARQSPLDRDVSTFLGEKVCPDRVTIYPIEREVIPWSLFKENKEGAS